MVIYIDVLFLINLYVTYFQLLAVMIFTHKNIPRLRLILSSVLGGIFSFSIFIPGELAVLATLIKLVACFLITYSAFGFTEIFEYLKNALFVLLINFIFAGIMLALWLFDAPLDMIYSNGNVYFDIDVLTIIVSTTIAYFVIRLVRIIFDKNGKTDIKYSVIIGLNGKICTISALADTANSLTDYFSGKPVIICKREECTDILPQNITEMIDGNINDISVPGKVRLIPFSTISSSGYVYAFKPDRVTIRNINENINYDVNALIGIFPDSKLEYGAIFNPKIII